MAGRVRAKVRDILEQYEPKPLPDGAEKRLQAIVDRAEAAHK
jgi:trimethylamine:corrinoid methyltransferase-like protein